MENIVKILSRHRHQVHVFCFTPRKSNNKWDYITIHELLWKQTQHYHSKFRLVLDIYLFLKVLFFLLRERVDVIHCHTPDGGFIGCFLKLVYLGRIPIITDIHGPFIPELIYYQIISPKSKFKSLFKALERMIYRISDRVVVTSEGLKKIVIRDVHSSKVSVLSDYVDTEIFYSTVDASDIKKRYGLEDKKVIMYVGMLKEYQGVDILIRSIPFVVKRIPNVVLVIVGNTNCNDYMKIAEEMQMEDKVMFVGLHPHKEIPKFMAAADVLVSPRIKTEVTIGGFTSQVPEYMAMGKPIIATDVSDCSTLLKDDHGVLVEPGSIESLARGILKVLGNPEMSKRIGKNAEKKAALFSWNAHYPEIISLYRSAISKRR